MRVELKAPFQIIKQDLPEPGRCQRGGFVRSGEIRSTGDLRTDLVPDLVPIYDPTYDPIYADLRPDIVPDHPISYPAFRYRTRKFASFKAGWSGVMGFVGT